MLRPAEPVPPDLHQPEPDGRPDRLLHHGLAQVRRVTQRRPAGVPDEPGAVPEDTFPPHGLFANHTGREGEKAVSFYAFLKRGNIGKMA